MKYSKETFLKLANFSQVEIVMINQKRGHQNRLGFAYQLTYVKIYNRFPTQQSVDVDEDILSYVSVLLGLDANSLNKYSTRQATISAHQNEIRAHLNLTRFSEMNTKRIEEFVFQKACQFEQSHALLSIVRDFLRKNAIIEPAESTLKRIIQHERQKAREHIYTKIYGTLTTEHKACLDQYLVTKNQRQSGLQRLKQPQGRASATAIIKITDKLDIIKSSGILDIDLSWLNNNLQRWMNRYVRQATASRLRDLTDKKRYALLVCFLKQHHRDLLDDLVRTYDKVINSTYNRTQQELNKKNHKEHKSIKSSLISFQTLANIILDENIPDHILRSSIYQKIDRNDLSHKRDEVSNWLNGKYKDVFTLLVNTRFSYLRQFSPSLFEHLPLEVEDAQDDSIIKAVELIKNINKSGKRKIDDEAPVQFIPQATQKLIVDSNGKLNKPAWECALITAVRDHIKCGNIAIKDSKRYGHIDEYFMPTHLWEAKRTEFFNRSGLPSDPKMVKEHLTNRLNKSFDDFLKQLPNNKYAQLDESGWCISKDDPSELTPEQEYDLEKLRGFLAKHMRLIKLPQLLIEVDNELNYTSHFTKSKKNKSVEDVCAIVATIMAQGCNIGLYTMSHLIDGISYSRIKNISDWFLTESSRRSALAKIVNAISNLDITKHWGSGKTSSSDGQRFSWRQKVLQQSYSHRFRDFALEFYTFIADNYAPYYATPIECTDRDAPYVLDGLCYNESDLNIEQHFTDTHGYTEINFAAFAMLGKVFSPRIKGIQDQKIYRIDPDIDYGPLNVLVNGSKRKIRMEYIIQQWDRMGQFYASLESGYTTASTALKRLNGYSTKNHFYRANQELGRIFKTEHILKVMSDKSLRTNTRIGLLKSEQLHQLARDLKYAKRGRITSRDWLEQQNSCSCLTLILASIIYWQAKEIHRVLIECTPDNDLNLNMLKHISPITWDNVILYGEYIIDPKWIKQFP